MHEPLHETDEETLHLEARKAVDNETGELGNLLLFLSATEL